MLIAWRSRKDDSRFVAQLDHGWKRCTAFPVDAVADGLVAFRNHRVHVPEIRLSEADPEAKPSLRPAIEVQQFSRLPLSKPRTHCRRIRLPQVQSRARRVVVGPGLDAQPSGSRGTTWIWISE